MLTELIDHYTYVCKYLKIPKKLKSFFLKYVLLQSRHLPNALEHIIDRMFYKGIGVHQQIGPFRSFYNKTLSHQNPADIQLAVRALETNFIVAGL